MNTDKFKIGDYWRLSDDNKQLYKFPIIGLNDEYVSVLVSDKFKYSAVVDEKAVSDYSINVKYMGKYFWMFMNINNGLSWFKKKVCDKCIK